MSSSATGPISSARTCSAWRASRLPAQTFARHFGTPPDLMEDPFTGSATGGMAAYLWRYNLIAEPAFIAEQGHWMNRPGQGTAEVIGPPDDIQTVKVGGSRGHRATRRNYHIITSYPCHQSPVVSYRLSVLNLFTDH